MIVISFFQYQREKEFRTEQLDQLLSTYNFSINKYIEQNNRNWRSLTDFLKVFPDSNLRVSVIDLKGVVLYDSYVNDVGILENHLDRPEIQDAISDARKGVVIRKSASTGMEFYYLAHRFENFFIRSALPYNMNLSVMLAANMYFLYFMILVLIIASLALFFISKNITGSIDRLQLFLSHAESEQFVNSEIVFPTDELGQISNNIVKTYKNLWITKSQVKREREKLIQHLQISQEGLGIFSAEKKEILVNSHFIVYAKMLSEKVLESVDEIFSIDEFKEINAFIDEGLKNKNLHRKRLNIEKGGKVFLIQCIVFNDATFEISINDITVQEQENKLKRHLTQNISHELKTPVSSILGYMESIVNNPDLAPERQRFFVERSFQQALRLTALLQDISTLNKIDETNDIFEREKVDVAEVIRDVLNDVNLQIEEKNVQVGIKIPLKVEIEGNRSLIYSIFRNLTDNALTYAGENIYLYINCYREDDQYYYFSFSDNGVGIQEEHLSRIFERFYRVDKGRTRKMGGTGLGLAIVKNAVIYHGGTISVKNITSGGLNFVFSLKKK
jgi:two-component system OmpR family sensor kinase/two-component system phosphate regulon sensor histidine kinase PhoR